MMPSHTQGETMTLTTVTYTIRDARRAHLRACATTDAAWDAYMTAAIEAHRSDATTAARGRHVTAQATYLSAVAQRTRLHAALLSTPVSEPSGWADAHPQRQRREAA